MRKRREAAEAKKRKLRKAMEEGDDDGIIEELFSIQMDEVCKFELLQYTHNAHTIHTQYTHNKLIQYNCTINTQYISHFFICA